MRNPTRRNKNIGTENQGYKKQSKFDIPSSWQDSKVFFEKLSEYKKVKRNINGYDFLFIVEKTKKDYFHACTIDDLEYLLHFIPSIYYQDLRTIVLRQPKKKEQIFSPVWGRLVWWYEFESDDPPVIILEAVKQNSKFSRSRKLDIDSQKELQRLRDDGFDFTETKRSFETILTIEKVRKVQLYRTLLHEIGHYYQFLTNIDNFDNIPSSEREVFAHRFAHELKIKLEKQEIIPFSRKFDEKSLSYSGLDVYDFQINS